MTDLPTLAWAGVRARRLARHHLAHRPPGASVVDAVRAMVGAHAQILTAAELSIGIRTDGTTSADVQQALWDDRSLVKARGPRGTIHLLPADDFGWWVTALAAIPGGIEQAVHARLTDEQTEQVLAALADAVADAELTIDEMSDAVIAATGPWAADPVLPMFGGGAPRWRQVMGFRESNGLLCFGPNRGRNVTYTSPARWLDGFRPEPDTGVALATLVTSYLSSYGPASPAELARWLAAPPRWAADLFDELAAQGRIAPVRLAGEAEDTRWVVEGDDEVVGRPSGVHLLPHFDAYGVGCHPRDRVFPGVASERALNRGQAGNFATLLVDGTVRGIWHHQRRGRRSTVTVEAFDPLSARHRRGLEREVARLGEFFALDPTLVVGPVTVGAHA